MSTLWICSLAGRSKWRGSLWSRLRGESRFLLPNLKLAVSLAGLLDSIGKNLGGWLLFGGPAATLGAGGKETPKSKLAPQGRWGNPNLSLYSVQKTCNLNHSNSIYILDSNSLKSAIIGARTE